MNTKATYLIRRACEEAQHAGIRVTPGAWVEYDQGKVVACCAIGAVVLSSGHVQAEHGTDLKLASRPGFVRAACQVLGVNPQWLYRFWMGFDRGHHITLVDGDNKESKDDVSGFGVQLRKELHPNF